MEVCRGNVLLFLTILICSTCVVAQTDSSTQAPTPMAGTSTMNQTAAPGNSSMDNTTMAGTSTMNQTPAPANSSMENTTAAASNNASDSTTGNSSMINTTPNTMNTTTAMMIDYCSSAPCIHGNCSNGNTTNYVCNCDTGFTGTNCENKLVLFPGFKNGFGQTGFGVSTAVINSLIPFPYFDRTVGYLFASERGYVSFGEEYYRVNAPIGTEWPYVPSLFGAYWTDMETYKGSLFWNVQDYMMRNVTESSPLVEYVKNIINEPNFEPLFIVMLTWPGMHPSPAVNYPNDVATVQLILTTDSQFSYAIKSYQTVFGNTGVAGRPRISTDYTRENGARATGDVPKNITGPLLMKLFTTGTPSKQPFECVMKVQDVKARLENAIESLPVCPLQLVQATTDGWFQVSSTSPSCYLSILYGTEGLQQKCCYNRFGLLIANTTEAGFPVQVNASGITLQAAFDQCCTVMPQLCMWFYRQFPTSGSRLYSTPFIAGTLGSMHFFTFDGNKYTLFVVGDFILFKSGNTQVQMRAQKNVATNTSSIESLAVQIADNTSNVQFYLTADNGMWTLNSGQGNTPAPSTYKIQQSNSSSTLMLQSVIITATKTMGVLSYTIRTNLKDPKSGGLLGSTDGLPNNNNFKYRNGTMLFGKAEQMTTSQIYSFAQSWKVQNMTESLFNYPGARSFEDAKNDAGFTPLEYPTTAAETLKMYTGTNRTAESAEAEKLCMVELFCLQEYFLSSNNMSAARVLEQTNNISFQKQQSAVEAPMFRFLPVSYRVNVSTTDVFSFSINSWNSIAAELTLVKDDLPNISASLTNDLFRWNVKSDMAKLRALTYPRNLKFYATSAAKLSDKYAPIIYLCLCEQTIQCDLSQQYRGSEHTYYSGSWERPQYMSYDDVVTDGNVKNMMCNCNGMAGGKFCEKKVDICLNCYNHTACDVSRVNYCAPCPPGFEGDGKLCLDINECSVNNGGCDHKCTNTEGSFTCACLPGFTQNGPKCIDINECLLNTNLCNDVLKMCINLPGTYTCSCFRGLVGEDSCIRAPYAFTGAIDLANSGNQMWNIKLMDTNSNEFKDLSGRVARSIMDGLTNGNVGTNSTTYVEVLSFSQVQNPSRTKRQAIPSNLHILARYAIYTASGSPTADTLNNALRDYKASSCNTSCQFGEIILYSDAPKVDSNADLCSYPQIHKCDTSTSFCNQLNQTTSCDCKMGFAYSTESESCRDIDECAGNNTKTCPETGVCMNTFGSYECECSAGRTWNTTTAMCVADICSTNPCKNDGACVALHNRDEFVCKCSYGWEGELCDGEDAEAERMKVALICVCVILGVCCLVLLIALIVVCVRQRRTLDNDTYTNSRHNEAEHLPRAKITHRSDTEMIEHGQGNGYEKLNHDEPNKFASKNVHENRAYEDDLAERL